MKKPYFPHRKMCVCAVHNKPVPCQQCLTSQRLFEYGRLLQIMQSRGISKVEDVEQSLKKTPQQWKSSLDEGKVDVNQNSVPKSS